MSRHKNIPAKGRGNLYDSGEDEDDGDDSEDQQQLEYAYGVSPNTSQMYTFNSERDSFQASFLRANSFTFEQPSINYKNKIPESFLNCEDFLDEDSNSLSNQIPPNRISGLHISSTLPNLAALNRSEPAGKSLPNASNKSSLAQPGGATPRRRPPADLDVESASAGGQSTPNAAILQRAHRIQEAFQTERIDANEEDGRESIAVVVIGHVDAGKSTLIGHLLYRLGQVDQKQMTRYQRDSQKQGKASFAFAWVMDQTEEERERGVTMDIAQTAVLTQKKRVTILDAPGHRDFIPRMITGAAQADAALLVINAANGEFEAGFSQGAAASTSSASNGHCEEASTGQSGCESAVMSTCGTAGQTREHAVLARSLGISKFIIVVNKMDAVNWSQARYQQIVAEVENFLRKLGGSIVSTACPVSGLLGLNVFSRLASDEADSPMSWCADSPCLMELLDRLDSPPRQVDRPLRFTVTDTFKPPSGAGVCVAGRVEAGCVCAAGVANHCLLNQVVCLPHSNKSLQVKNIQRTGINQSGSSGLFIGETGDQSLNWAFAGDLVTLTLTGTVDAMQPPEVGCVICHSMPLSQLVPVVTRLRAQLLLLALTRPLCRGFTANFHCQSVNCVATIVKLHRFQGRDAESGRRIDCDKPRFVTQVGQLEATIKLSRQVCLDTVDNCRAIGRFSLRNKGITIAGGNIVEVFPAN